MNQKVLYSMMAVTVIPGATLQAAVYVPVDQAEQVATQVGESYEVSVVVFGTLAPGKYTLSGMLTDGADDVTAATLAGQALTVSSGIISGTITISELTNNARLVISGTKAFTLGTYSLKLEWTPSDAQTPLNTLLSSVRTKVETDMNGLLTVTHKAGFKNQLDAQATAIAKLEVYDHYLNNELWKVGEGKDVISLAIKEIETNAETTCLADRWAAKEALYEAALKAIPSDDKLTALEEAIGALAVNKEKRQGNYNDLDELVSAYKDAAAAALDEANKPESWDAEDGFDFDFEPDPSADDITNEYNALNRYVAQDKENAERYATLTARVATAVENIGKVEPEKTKNQSARDTNVGEKEDIENGLSTYGEDAKDDFEATIDIDGEEFVFDPDFNDLTDLEGRITALQNQITADNEDYAQVKEDIDGLFTAAEGYYPAKMTQLAENVTDQDILEQAQTDLFEQKKALADLKGEYDVAYEAGEDIDPAEANAAIKAIKAEMDDIVIKATFADYKVTQKAAADALGQAGDSDAAKVLITNAKNAIDALNYDGSKTFDQNKAAVDAILTQLGTDLAAQRAADQLAADKATFADYKTTQKAAANALAEEGDSQASQKIIADAVAAIDDLNYDEGKTLAQNKAAVDAILTQLGTDLAAQRATDQLAAWEADFNNYKTEQINALEAQRVDGNDMIDGLINNAEDDIDKVKYDKNKTLDENKAKVDEIVAAVNPEITAAGLVEYINDLVSSTYTTLRKAVVDSQSENTGNMLDKDAELEDEYGDLLDAIDAIEKARDIIDKTAIADDVEFDPETEEDPNLYNTYVKKVKAFNALLSQMGKTTDEEGTLYAEFNDLKSRAEASAAAKTANDNAFTKLTAELNDLQGKLNTAKAAIDEFDDYVQNKFADEEGRIQGLINTDRTTLGNANTAQTLTANSKNANATAIANAITKLSADAAAAQAAYEVSEAAYAELVKEFDPAVEGSLQAQLNEAADYIEENDGDVAASFAGAIDAIQEDIDAAKHALDEARANSALTATSTIENKAAIEADITKLKDKADKKQAKYTNNNTLTAQWSEVSIYLAEQRSLTVEAAGEGAATYYRTKFNGQGGYVEQLNTIKTEIATAFSDETVEAAVFLTTYQTKLNNLKTEIGKELGKAEANWTSYDKQKTAYDSAVDFYTKKYTELTTEYEQEYVEAEIEEIEDYSPEDGELKDVLATIENNYVKGTATTVESMVLTGLLPDITGRIQAILDGLDAENSEYYQAIRDANNETLNEVIETIQGIRDAYNNAVKALENKNFKGATDDGLKTVIEAEAKTLSEVVFGAIQQQTDYNSQANTLSTTATDDRKVWDATDFIADVEDYIQTLVDAQETFTTNVKGAITGYWDSVKSNSVEQIDYLFGRLNSRGYIQNEETEGKIFEDAYKKISEGDALVDEEEGTFNVSAIEALAADLSNNKLVDVANTFAKSVAQAAVNEYTKTGGKKDVAWSEIVEIFPNGDTTYGQPENEDSMEDQFAYIVTITIEQAQTRANNVIYNTRLTNVTNLLATFDDGVDGLKATAQQWVENQKQADADLAAAQDDLTDAKEGLKELVGDAQEAYEILAGKVNKTSVAGDYADMLDEICALISVANDVATATTMPETLEDVDDAKADVAEQVDILTGGGIGTVVYLMQAVEQGVIDDLKFNLALLIPDLKAQFNAYAATENPDNDKLTNWNERIQNAITLTDPNNPSTLEDMIALEQDIAKLRTEMGVINGDVAETIADFKARTQDLLKNAKLDAEADYGNKATDFANRLTAIQNEVAAIAAEVTQHETDGDILPYIDNLEGRIKAQESAWVTLQSDAEDKAKRVSDNKTTLEGWKTTLTNLINAELVPEVNYENYGEEPDVENGLASRLESIHFAATELLGYLEAEGRYDYFVNLDDAKTHSIANSITYNENRWKTLQENAANQYEAWDAHKEASNAIYAQLQDQIDAIIADIENAKEAINEYTNANKAYFINQLDDLKDDTVLGDIEAEKAAYTLDDDDVNPENEDSYFNQLANFGDQVTPIWNAAAKEEAWAIYFADDSDLMTAESKAWEVWSDWTFSSTVKNSFCERLNTIDGEMWYGNGTDESTGFATTIWGAEDAHIQLESEDGFAKTAADLIAKYNAVVEDMNGYAKFGDANVDGKVNVLDYQKVANMILDPTIQPKDTDKLFSVIDITQNEVIEVGDLVAIVNYILDNDWQNYAYVKGWSDDAVSEGLTMTTSVVQPGVQRIAVNLQNVEEYTAFQLDVLLPEGMTIVGQSLSDRAGNSHKLWSRAQQDGSIRLLASSIKGETFSGNEGAVLYIDVETGANFNGGNVELLNILFSDTSAQTRAFAVDANGEATGINFMATIESLKQKVYDLSGRVMNGMKKGVNIIQNADGTTKKVLK